MNLHMNTNSITNILVYKDVASILKVRITMNTSNVREILVHWNGNLIKFSGCDDGLYFFGIDTPKIHLVTKDSTNIVPKQAIKNYYIITNFSKNK